MKRQLVGNSRDKFGTRSLEENRERREAEVEEKGTVTSRISGPTTFGVWASRRRGRSQERVVEEGSPVASVIGKWE